MAIMSKEQTHLIDQEIREMLWKEAISAPKNMEGQLMNLLCLVGKKGWEKPSINQCKRTEQRILYSHSKTEDLLLLNGVVLLRVAMCKVDLEDEHFVAPLSQNSQKYARFQWKSFSHEF